MCVFNMRLDERRELELTAAPAEHTHRLGHSSQHGERFGLQSVPALRANRVLRARSCHLLLGHTDAAVAYLRLHIGSSPSGRRTAAGDPQTLGHLFAYVATQEFGHVVPKDDRVSHRLWNHRTSAPVGHDFDFCLERW